jgi:hypothetical protein
VSLLRNLGAGSYTPVDRVRKIVGNVLIKVRKRQACCGNYGDPGC